VGPITNPALEQNTKRSGQKDRYDEEKSALEDGRYRSVNLSEFEWLIYEIPNTVENVPIVLPKNQRIHQITALGSKSSQQTPSPKLLKPPDAPEDMQSSLQTIYLPERVTILTGPWQRQRELALAWFGTIIRWQYLDPKQIASRASFSHGE